MSGLNTERSRRVQQSHENEPLLSGAGGTGLTEGKPIAHNLILGTAALAQVGIFAFVIILWASVFMPEHKLIGFDGHPLLNSLGLLLVVEAVLVLQPTGTYDLVQKKKAACAHATLIALAAASFVAAIATVIWWKSQSHLKHFESVHSLFGLATYVLIFLQALVGFTQLFTPRLYGGEANAKKIYKYHRTFGYAVILPLLLITVIAATWTGYGAKILKIRTWAVVLAALAIVTGVYPRINIAKLRGRRTDNREEERR